MAHWTEQQKALREEANKNYTEALVLLSHTKPHGRMSDIGALIGTIPSNKFAATIHGQVYIWHKKNRPSDTVLKIIEDLFVISDSLNQKSAEFIFYFTELRPNTTIGNKKALEKAIYMADHKMLNHTELNNLELIEQFWKENPDADSGIISADGKRIEPWYSQVKKVS